MNYENIETNMVKLIEDEDRTMNGGSTWPCAASVTAIVTAVTKVADTLTITSACSSECIHP